MQQIQESYDSTERELQESVRTLIQESKDSMVRNTQENNESMKKIFRKAGISFINSRIHYERLGWKCAH
jgi:TRAP-type C4-dicarboxylate transport system substrate-binding protein